MPPVPIVYNYNKKPYSKWKKKGAQYSGAMLGWIGNNLPGAFAGYKYGGEWYDKYGQGNSYASTKWPSKRLVTKPHRARKDMDIPVKGPGKYKSVKKGQVFHRHLRWKRAKFFKQDVVK